MKKLLYFLLVTVLLASRTQAQPTAPQLPINQITTIGTVVASPYGLVATLTVAADAQGNTYLAGSFDGTVSFGSTTLTAVGSDRDVFVAKRNAAGSYLWAVQAGGLESERIAGVALDAAGNVYVTGQFDSQYAMFGTTTLTNASSPYRATNDIFVAKLSTNGAWQWATSAGGGNTISGNDYGKAVSVDAVGNVYVAGIFGSSVAFFGTAGRLVSGTGNNGFVAQLSPAGTWQWVQITCSAGDSQVAMVANAAGEIFITGAYHGSAGQCGPFTVTNPLGSPVSASHVFVGKLDTFGTWLWATGVQDEGAAATAATGQTQVGSLFLDGMGNLYTAGSFTSEVARFGTTVLTNTGAVGNSSPNPSTLRRTSNAYVAKLNAATGAWRWALQSSGDGHEGLSSPLYDGRGHLYVGGSFSPPTFMTPPTSATFGTITLASTSNEGIVARLDTAGRWEGVWRASSSSGVYLGGYGFNSQGYLLLGGAFSGPSATFGSATLVGNALADYTFLLGIAGPLTPLSARLNTPAAGLAVYPNPTHGSVTVNGLAPAQAVQVFDVLGRRITQGRMPANGPLLLPLPAGQAAGVYVVRGGGQARRLMVE